MGSSAPPNGVSEPEERETHLTVRPETPRAAPSGKKMNAYVEFWRALIDDPFAIGAITPSSRFLGEAMIEGIDLSHGTIVEFGPGTGALTAVIRDHLTDRSRYLGIEFNDRFVDLLQNKFDDLTFHQGSAADFDSIVKEHGIEDVSAIISGVPFASLPDEIEDGIIDALDRGMTSGTHFRMFQYAHAFYLPRSFKFRDKMIARFGQHQTEALVVRNIPPAFVISFSR